MTEKQGLSECQNVRMANVKCQFVKRCQKMLCQISSVKCQSANVKRENVKISKFQDVRMSSVKMS